MHDDCLDEYSFELLVFLFLFSATLSGLREFGGTGILCSIHQKGCFCQYFVFGSRNRGDSRASVVMLVGTFSEPCTASSYVDRSWPRGVMSPHAAKTQSSLLRKSRASAASRFLCVVQEPTLPVWLRQKMNCLRVLCQNCKENAFCQN